MALHNSGTIFKNFLALCAIHLLPKYLQYGLVIFRQCRQLYAIYCKMSHRCVPNWLLQSANCNIFTLVVYQYSFLAYSLKKYIFRIHTFTILQLKNDFDVAKFISNNRIFLWGITKHQTIRRPQSLLKSANLSIRLCPSHT